MTTAPVAKIIQFSAVDGPGNRSVVFLQGCNQNCLYCHNPETINRCFECGLCARQCPTGALTYEKGTISYDFGKCIWCDTCIQLCPNCSNPRTREMSAEDVLKAISNSLPFIRGVTISGGECTLHPQFITELAQELHENGKTLFVDTNGQIDLSQYPEMVSETDAFMIDLKASSDEEAQRLLGVRIQHVVPNIRLMAQQGKLYEIRTVMCPSAMDVKKTVELGASLIKDYPEVRYKLIRYRSNGVRAQFQWLEEPDEDTALSAETTARTNGVTNLLIV